MVTGASDDQLTFILEISWRISCFQPGLSLITINRQLKTFPAGSGKRGGDYANTDTQHSLEHKQEETVR